MTGEVDRMAGQVMAGLAEMFDENDQVRPGTVMAAVVAGDEVDGGRALSRYVMDLLKIDEATCETVLHRVALAADFTADILGDVDRL